MPSDAEAQDITLKRSAIVTLLMVARWVSGALALGLLALIAMALMQMRENGRYQGIVDGWTLIIIDTHTGEWLKTRTDTVYQGSSTVTGRDIPYNRWMPVIYPDAPAKGK
jgi:hypothetical protein